jgi:uncharacterized alkaline shock family protein YloU
MSERVTYVVASNAEVRVDAVHIHIQGIKVRK